MFIQLPANICVSPKVPSLTLAKLSLWLLVVVAVSSLKELPVCLERPANYFSDMSITQLPRKIKKPRRMVQQQPPGRRGGTTSAGRGGSSSSSGGPQRNNHNETTNTTEQTNKKEYVGYTRRRLCSVVQTRKTHDDPWEDATRILPVLL
jgi:hypothetical protein